MRASADRLDFAPPPEPAAIRAFVLAVIAHLLLMAALTWGVQWQKETNVAAEAELWSRIPEQAAPPPAPEVPPQPAPPPPVVEKPAPPPVAKEPDIVQEREKKRLEEEARRLREEEERKVLEAKKKQQEEAAKREQAAKEKAAEERKKQEQLAKAERDKKDDAKLAQLREENLRRMQGLAGSSGGPSATGSALRSKGPSASYAGMIAGRIKPNIVFSDVVGGNPAAVVQLRVAPDGTIVGSKLVKSSGVKNWDDAVLRAIDRTGSIPRDTDGSVVPEFEIVFRPKD
jgi:colicin import membrane protein